MTMISLAASRKFKWGIVEAVVAGATREAPVSCGCRIVARMADPAILRDAADRKTSENCNCEHV